ncbi:MAG: signal peptidase II [Desulfobulbaceae bacterium S3730MH12]|nr:MAG: signal peptidase II [Desulfobulbaceae bacterium S5133MH15]OEU58549.1 MAG: signal peptidase II [Desulfobulbaceae bacterium S3730MH12]OEU78450.1 MAG: signal peptidase II [Desulfobulbaceae bacterium C00003063]
MSYIILMAITVIADQLTKAWVLNSFQLYESKEVIPDFFNLVYVTNTGAAFSILAGVDSAWKHYFFLGVGGVALIGLTIARFRLRKENSLYGLALALICGGAVGNLIDRIRFGSVVDFLDFHLAGYHWPAFNIADSAICIGAGLFLVVNILESRKQKKEV